ncbi:MAG: hypothetical protein NVS3B20_10170 [Polyangiales bacterium]
MSIRAHAERRWCLAVASILGSFVVYGAHLACTRVGTRLSVPLVPAQTIAAPSVEADSAASAIASAPAETQASASCNRCGFGAPTSVATFTVSGDEKIVLDPLDSSSEINVRYGRDPLGKKVVMLSSVVRAYRIDRPSERLTTFALRVTLPESGGQPSSPRDLEGYLMTWGGGPTSNGLQIAPRSYTAITKSSLTYTIGAEAIEIRGSVTLKDAPTGKVVSIEKLSILSQRKGGDSLLPFRGGGFRLQK